MTPASRACCRIGASTDRLEVEVCVIAVVAVVSVALFTTPAARGSAIGNGMRESLSLINSRPKSQGTLSACSRGGKGQI